MRTRRLIGMMLVVGLLTGPAPAARAADLPDQFDLTPPRLSYADGNVSFWRQGADDWAPAQVNTPLAPGDELYTSSPANLEIQIGPRAFVRTWANTQLGLGNQEPDFLQFKVTSGSAAFDLRSIEPGTTVEVATPNAALTIEHPGYYRVDVTGDRTSFITRRSGHATVTPASGEAVVITPSEEVVIEGTSSPRVTSYVAPPLDGWDKWNYARSDTSLDTLSARYVSPGTYGVSDLDRYGTWRAVPDYGTVWIPTTVQPGWAPYTTGSWTLDPNYGWTWVDTAPWGWAPYHYGRWVSVNGFWGWAPGPVIARPVYAPALVAFFGGPNVSVGINIGGPVLGWVALGWGEPIVPWWGRPGVARQPSWRGWGGPHVVNDVVINNTTVVNVQNINVYRNTSVRNAVVVVNENRFGRGPITGARISRVDVKDLRPTHAAPQVTATPASFVPTAGRGARPPEASLKRSVVATRPSRVGPTASAVGGEPKAGPPGNPMPAPRIVSAPPRREPDAIPPRPPFGQSNVERRTPDRAQPSSPPRPPVARQVPPPTQREPQVAAPVPTTTPPVATPVTTSPPRGRVPEKQEIAAPPSAVPPAPAMTTPSTPPARRPERPQAAVPPAGTPPTPTTSVTAPPPASPATAPAAPAAPAIAPPAASPVTTPAVPARRPERPQAAVPPAGTPPTPTTSVTAPPPASPVTTPAAPARRPERPQVTAPSQTPSVAATPSIQAPPPARRTEQPQVASPPAGPATAPPAAGRRPERPQAAAPTSAPPSSVAAPAPAPPARRPVAAVSPAKPPLPGEPANQLSPNRRETQQPQPAQR